MTVTHCLPSPKNTMCRFPKNWSLWSHRSAWLFENPFRVSYTSHGRQGPALKYCKSCSFNNLFTFLKEFLLHYILAGHFNQSHHDSYKIIRCNRCNRDVIVFGGGNAGLVAALAANEVGVRVAVLEAAPKEERGGWWINRGLLTTKIWWESSFCSYSIASAKLMGLSTFPSPSKVKEPREDLLYPRDNNAGRIDT